MEKEWNYKAQPNEQLVKEVQSALRLDEITSGLLAQRGITDLEQAQRFFRPELRHLHDPFLLKGMQEAVDRINFATKNKENILIYGDYDVDGTTAVALVHKYLIAHYQSIAWYIPDRYKEGYGISSQGIAFSADNNIKLIIALDCGIKSIDKVDLAKHHGIDFIICDHHTPGEALPDAIIINPKQADCSYPYKELSGCALGFKLIHAWTINNHLDEKEVYKTLDLVALSTAADIVDMTGENRILTWHGMRQINNGNGNKGIMAILQQACKNIPIDIETLVFIVAPRINAAGRLDSATKAVDLLISDSDNVFEKVLELETLNQQRKVMDAVTTAEALNQIQDDRFLRNAVSTIVYSPTWHKGVVGIVAARLIETYYRPTIVLTQNDGVLVGSARSVQGFNLYEALESCSNLLIQFGGHAHAAGLSLKLENLDAFRNQFDEYTRQKLGNNVRNPPIDIDLVVDAGQITENLHNRIKYMEPFGPGNMKPMLSVKRVKNLRSREVGKDGSHLKLELISTQSDKTLDGIAFGMANQFKSMQQAGELEIAFHLSLNSWNNKTSIQLMAHGIRRID